MERNQNWFIMFGIYKKDNNNNHHRQINKPDNCCSAIHAFWYRDTLQLDWNSCENHAQDFFFCKKIYNVEKKLIVESGFQHTPAQKFSPDIYRIMKLIRQMNELTRNRMIKLFKAFARTLALCMHETSLELIELFSPVRIFLHVDNSIFLLFIAVLMPLRFSWIVTSFIFYSYIVSQFHFFCFKFYSIPLDGVQA